MKVNFKYIGIEGSEYTPHHATPGASGCDLRNASGKVIKIYPQTSVRIPTGICVEIPEGFEGQLRPRSGISVKKQLIMLPSVGTIDLDFRGEVKATYFNPTNIIRVIDKDERIAQLIIAPYAKCDYNSVEELTETSRTGGFGSTGEK